MLEKSDKHTVADVVKDGLCTSCGICAGSCLKSSIAFHYGEERNDPIVDNTTCIKCGMCYDICPGKGIALENFSSELYKDENGASKNKYAGYYLHSFVGHCNDEEIRFHSATGGMVTGFLIGLLKKRVIDGAVVVRYKKENPFEPEPFIATTPEEIWESRSSKYIVLSMDNVSKEIASGQYKNLVVVGLPCQIQGWRQLAEKNKRVRESIKGYFSIYCSINKSKLSMDYYHKHYKIETSEVGRFAFRDDGCMGYMKYEDRNGDVIKKIPYRDYWFGTHSFFTNPRCLMCIDQLGELADLSFGDIHIKPYSDDTIGTNSIIARSSYWEALLNECKEDGAISLKEISMETLVRSQVYVRTYKKGGGSKAYSKIKKLIGKKTPEYDYQYDGSVSAKDYVVAASQMLMHFIGKRKQLWWIVKLLDF